MSESEKGYGALDEETVARVLYAFEQVRGCRGFTENEALKVLNWASRIEFEHIFLDLIKEGKIGVDLRDDGEVTMWPITPPTLN